MAHDDQDAARTPLLCEHCGDPIGVYEPLVYVNDLGHALRSSVLRMPQGLRPAPEGVRFFHAVCHGLLG